MHPEFRELVWSAVQEEGTPLQSDLGDSLVVLDFKTDSVKKDELSSKIEHYKPQVKVYSDAIGAIFGQPPKEVILFFLHLMEPVSVAQ